MPCIVLNAGQTTDWSDLSSSYTLLPHSASIPKSSDQHLTWPDWQVFGNTCWEAQGQCIPCWRQLREVVPVLRRLSLKQQKLSWVLTNMNIRIGLMRMTSVSLSCYVQRMKPIWSDKMTQSSNPRQTNSDISEDKPRRDCARWKTIGRTERQMMCKSLQTQTTPNNTSEHWRLYAGPHNLDSPLYYQLIQAHTIWTHPFTISWWINTDQRSGGFETMMGRTI